MRMAGVKQLLFHSERVRGQAAREVHVASWMPRLRGMRVVVVHNPTSGGPKHDREALLALIRRAGHQPIYFSSADDAWRSATREPIDLIAAAGGDGTVEKVARELAGRPVPIAVLPLGTANNLSSALGQSGRSLEALVLGWCDGVHKPIDLGVAHGPRGPRYFLESVGLGLIAHIIADSSHEDGSGNPARWHPGTRVAAARGRCRLLLRRIEAVGIELELDGRDYSGRYVLVEALNFGVVGPQLLLSRTASPSDGLIDVVLVGDVARHDLVRHLSWSQNEPSTAPPLVVHQGQHVKLSCEACLFHVDDKIWPTAEPARCPLVIDLEVKPGALIFLAPRP
jgi:diacylglycerol kinase family enzyme